MLRANAAAHVSRTPAKAWRDVYAYTPTAANGRLWLTKQTHTQTRTCAWQHFAPAGQGVYFARDSTYPYRCSGCCDGCFDADGNFMMMLCLVQTGIPCVGEEHMVRVCAQTPCPTKDPLGFIALCMLFNDAHCFRFCGC